MFRVVTHLRSTHLPSSINHLRYTCECCGVDNWSLKSQDERGEAKGFFFFWGGGVRSKVGVKEKDLIGRGFLYFIYSGKLLV